MTPEERIEALERLVRDYQAYLRQIAPLSWRDSLHVKSLRERTVELLAIKEEEPQEQAEEVHP